MNDDQFSNFFLKTLVFVPSILPYPWLWNLRDTIFLNHRTTWSECQKRERENTLLCWCCWSTVRCCLFAEYDKCRKIDGNRLYSTPWTFLGKKSPHIFTGNFSFFSVQTLLRNPKEATIIPKSEKWFQLFISKNSEKSLADVSCEEFPRKRRNPGVWPQITTFDIWLQRMWPGSTKRTNLRNIFFGKANRCVFGKGILGPFSVLFLVGLLTAKKTRNSKRLLCPVHRGRNVLVSEEVMRYSHHTEAEICVYPLARTKDWWASR